MNILGDQKMDRRMGTLKGVSIVIPTRNRVGYVQRLFISLYDELKTFEGVAEVIVIDNSDPTESAKIANMCKEYAYIFKALEANISEARNYGVNAAKYPIILFIDSDCEVMQGLLQRHVSSYIEEDIGGILGLTNFTGKENWLWKAIEKTPFHIAFSFAARMDYVLWGPCTNISFRKDVLEEVGGFKTKFPFDYSGEDVDIGLRVNELGYKIKCDSSAVVSHGREPWSNFGSFCKKVFRWGRTDFHLLRNHSHLSSIEFPRYSTILLILFVCSLIFQLTGLIWRMSELLLVWILCTPIIEVMLSTHKSKFNNFFSNYISFWLIFIFELGAMFESIRNGSLSMLNKKIVYGNGQLIFEWDQKVVQCWSYIITISLIIAISLI